MMKLFYIALLLLAKYGFLEIQATLTRPAKLCQRLRIPFLVADCTNERNVGSSCRLSCRGNLYLVGGIRTIQCRPTGLWKPDLRRVRCTPINPPPLPTCPRHSLSYKSRCSNSINVGSVCDLSCASDQLLLGKVSQVTCLSNGRWSADLSNTRCIPIDPRCPAVPSGVFCFRAAFCDIPCTEGRICCPSPCGTSCLDIPPEVDPRCPALPPHNVVCKRRDRCNRPCSRGEVCCATPCGETCTDVTPDVDPRCPPRRLEAILCPALPPRPPPSCPICRDDQECCPINCFGFTCTQFPPACDPRQPQADCIGSSCTGGGCPAFPDAVCFESSCGGCYPAFTDSEVGVIPSFACELGSNWPSCLAATTCSAITDPNCNGGCERHPYLSCVQDCDCNVVYIDPSNGREIDQDECEPVVDPRCPPVPDGIVCAIAEFCDLPCSGDEICCPSPCGTTCTDVTPDVDPRCPSRRLEAILCPAVQPYPPPSCPSCPVGQGCCPIHCFDFTCTQFPPGCHPDQPQAACIGSSCSGASCPAFPNAVCFESFCGGCYPAFTDSEVGVIPGFACELGSNWPSCLAATTCSAITDPNCNGGCERHPYLSCVQDCDCNVVYIDPSNGREIDQNECEPVVDPRCPPVPDGIVCAIAEFCDLPCSGDEICCPSPCGTTCTDVTPVVDPRCPPRRLDFCPAFPPRPPPSCPICRDDQGCCPINCFGFTCTQFPPDCHPGQPQARCGRPPCLGARCPAFPDAVCFESSCGGCFPAFTDGEVGVIPSFACELGSNWPSCLAATTCSVITDPNCNGGCERHPYLSCVQDCECNVVYIDPSNGREIDQNECETVVDPRCPPVPVGIKCVRAEFCDLPCSGNEICCPSPCGTTCTDVTQVTDPACPNTPPVQCPPPTGPFPQCPPQCPSGQICCDHPCAGTSCIPRPVVDPRCPPVPIGVVCAKADFCVTPCSGDEICCPTACGETCTDVSPQVDERCPPRRLEGIFCPEVVPSSFPTCPSCPEDQACCPINCFDYTCTQFPPACDPRQPQADCFRPSCTGGGCPAFPNAVCFESSCGGCYPAFTDSEVGVIPRFACELGSNWPSCLAATTCLPIVDPSCFGRCERHPYLRCVQDCNCNVVFIDPSNGREIDQSECERETDPDCPPLPAVRCAAPQGLLPRCPSECPSGEICCPVACGGTVCKRRPVSFCPQLTPQDGSSSLRFTCSSNIYRTGTTCDIGCRSSRYRLTGIKQTRCSSSGRWVPSVESTQCIITPLCFGRRVTCIADPCQGVSCPALPGAVCVQNNCNSCGFDFYLNGSRIPKRSCIQRGPCLLPTNHRYSCVFCPRTAVCHRRPDAICRPDCLCIPRFYDPKTFEKLNCIPVTIG